ncbi:MAG: FAD-binding oxidoreductase, partial [Nocardioides sp.]|nr:FAD-binding oxidoreductase [Nocardioides sp.]
EAPPGWSGLYDAGQHLVISHQIAGQRIERCYTIASPPTRSGTLTITIKRHPDGVLSNWLHDTLRPGDRMRARGPYGEFSLRAHPGERLLFLAAGSGLTPAMSMMRTLADTGSEVDVAFAYSARTPADIIFRRELAALPEQGLRIRSAIMCEEDAPGEHWDGPKGRLSPELLAWLVPDLASREVFLCGPPGYMGAAIGILDGLGLAPDRIHQESFDLGAVAGPFADVDPASAVESRPVRIELRLSGTQITCPADSTVLDAVLDAGVILQSSCRQGLCGTCKLTLLEGEVDMRHQGGIRPREIGRGMFLPCCSRPLGDLVLEA